MNRNVVLIGFMACGKDTVAREIGRRSGRVFLSLDRLIELRAGQTVAEIFKLRAEAGFRKIEREALASIQGLKNIALATGGGAVLDPQNRGRLKRMGFVVHLRCGLDTVEKRIGRDRTRPLARSRPALRRLFEARRKSYDFCDWSVDADGLSPVRIADRIIDRAGSEPRAAAAPAKVIRIRGSDRTSSVAVGSRILSDPSRLARLLPGMDRAVIVSDPVVSALFLDRTVALFQSLGVEARPYLVPRGERAKDLKAAARLYDFLAREGYGRSDGLIGLGGGVVTDLTGFCAATFKRGMRLIHVPTTLLAQVDAAVGGKCGVNHACGKNLIGAFYQPDLVVCDPDTLLTLPDDEFRNGLAEVVKCGFVSRPGLFAKLESRAAAVLERRPELLAGLVADCVGLKEKVVEADEREEKGLREILNFGHTVGHALEKILRIGHGACVAIGMVQEAKRSVRLGRLPDRDRARLELLLARLGLPVEPPQRISNADLMRFIRQDKKIRRGRLRLPLPEAVGKTTIKEVKWKDFL